MAPTLFHSPSSSSSSHEHQRRDKWRDQRRKGKPRAKTKKMDSLTTTTMEANKSYQTRVSSFTKRLLMVRNNFGQPKEESQCDKSLVDTEVCWSNASQSVHLRVVDERAIAPPPLISISIAAESSGESFKRSRGSSMTIESNARLSCDSSSSSSSMSSSSDESLDIKQLSMQKAHEEPKTTTIQANCDSEHTATSACGIESAHASLATLLSYNILQSLFATAILFSVINCIHLISWLIDTTSHTPTSERRFGVAHKHLCSNISTATLVVASQTRVNSLVLLLVLITTSLALVVIVALSMLQFQRSPQVGSSTGSTSDEKKATRRCTLLLASKTIRKSIHYFGIALSALAFGAPFFASSMNNLIGGELYTLCLHNIVAQQSPQPIITTRLLPFVAFAVYSLPLFLAASGGASLKRPHAAINWLGQILYLLAVVPLCYHVWSAVNGRDKMRAAVIALVLLVVAIAGQLRKWTFVSLASVQIESGADELIEAKVSLEQQRQQQETLLLSVLPAYVAEQVKRTMVKKMESLDTDNQLMDATSQLVSYAPTHAPLAHQQSLPTQTLTTQANHQVDCNTTSHLPARVARLSSSLTTSHASQHVTPQHNHDTNIQHQASNSTQQAGCNNSMLISSHAARRGFNELYIRTYNNVSLLYGDIVGFTRLCTQLSSSQLVRVLNDLFSYFDHLAEQHKIMRIKILGDCYYGVSGIPEFAVLGAKTKSLTPMLLKSSAKSFAATNLHNNGDDNEQQHRITTNNNYYHDNHACNCVQMGLDMISYIKCLNIERGAKRDVQCSNDDDTVRPTVLNNVEKQNQNQLPAHFELNMRIGIHTGHIHSGVIGLKKWQFDVWSNDVSIAMHCESSGVAGRVQVTEATIQHLRGAFSFEASPSARSDSFLADKGIRTFLIKERLDHRDHHQADALPSNRTKMWHSKREQQRCECNNYLLNKLPVARGRYDRKSMNDEDKIRAATIGTIKQTLLAGETHNSNASNAFGLALDHSDLKRFSLRFQETNQEKQYETRPLASAQLVAQLLLVFILLSIVLVYTLNRFYLHDTTHQMLTTFVVTLTGILLLLAACPQLGCCCCCCERATTRNSLRSNKSSTTDNSSKQTDCRIAHQNNYLRRHTSRDKKNIIDWVAQCFERVGVACKCLLTTQRTSFRPAKSRARTCLVVITFVMIIMCQFYVIYVKNPGDTTSDSLIELHQLSVLLIVIAIELCISLLSYSIKCILTLALVICQVCAICVNHNKQANNDEQNNNNDNEASLNWLFTHNLLLCAACLSLMHLRRLEYANRCNFLWRNRLNVDHEELEYISGINKILLENILPSHVVQHYLTLHSTTTMCNEQQQQQQSLASSQRVARMNLKHMRHLTKGGPKMMIPNSSACCGTELYHEQHESVAVMFASIPHFYEFYDESDISKQGLGCIALLNEIICDFDKLLLKNKFSRIEKIKTIGSTYMAAAGLSRRPTTSGAIETPTMKSSSLQQECNQTSLSLQAQNNNHELLQAGQPTRALHSTASSESILRATSQATSQSSGDFGSGNNNNKFVSSQQKMNLICMIQFATSLMSTLNGINKQSFQVFKLRVGVNTGPVIAGIIGAQRPFYDIWGDCVNIASRMESLGEVGRIQVEERTAKILLDCLCAENYSIVRRGPIDVKGKGGMVTYFIDKKQQQQLYNRQQSSELNNGAKLDCG